MISKQLMENTGENSKYKKKNPRKFRPKFFRNPQRRIGGISLRDRDLLNIAKGRAKILSDEGLLKEYDKISEQIYRLDAKRPRKPRTAFQLFVDKKRTEFPNIRISEIQRIWKSVPEYDQLLEESWNKFQEYLEESKEFYKSYIELLNKLRVMSGIPPLYQSIEKITARDLFWNDQGGDKGNPANESKYMLHRRKNEEWKKQTSQVKRYYWSRAKLKMEDIFHERNKEIIRMKIEFAKKKKESLGKPI